MNREGSNKLIDLTRSLASIPVTGEKTSRVDDDVLNRIIADQSELQRLYKRDPKALQALVETETSAAEIKELKNRRDVVSTMQSWLDDHEAFAEAKNVAGALRRRGRTFSKPTHGSSALVSEVGSTPLGTMENLSKQFAEQTCTLPGNAPTPSSRPTACCVQWRWQRLNTRTRLC